MKKRCYHVKEVAQLATISIRTLHHYDAIGLLVPHGRTHAGYRLYDDDDLLRLQQILIARTLGWSLEAIRHSLDDPSFDRRTALLDQRNELTKRLQQTEAMVQAIDHALTLLAAPLTTKEFNMKDLFNGFDPAMYDDEVQQRWGTSPAYQESKRRTQNYSAAQWQEQATEQEAIYRALFAVMQERHDPSSVEAMELAERHRLAIDRWFYSCSHAMHLGLAEMYLADSRFAATIDGYGTGLTPYLSAAILANAKRYGVEHSEPRR